jgi:hypothetical protein
MGTALGRDCEVVKVVAVGAKRRVWDWCAEAWNGMAHEAGLAVAMPGGGMVVVFPSGAPRAFHTDQCVTYLDIVYGSKLIQYQREEGVNLPARWRQKPSLDRAAAFAAITEPN